MGKTPEKYALNARLPMPLYEAVKEAAETQGLDLTGAAHAAFRSWLRDSPAATTAEEMWVLRALRALAAKHPGLLAQAILSLSVSAAEDAGFPLPEAMHEDLAAVSEAYKRERQTLRDRRALLEDQKRKAPPTR